MADSDDSRTGKSRACESMIDPLLCLDFIRDNARSLAQAKANRVYIEESLRTVKATEMQKHSSLSVGAQEREAYASEAYKVALEGLRTAVEAEESLRWLMVAAQAKVEVWRTMSANDRRLDRAAA